MQFHDKEWKLELALHRDQISAADPRVDGFPDFRYEKAVLLSAFIIRKLIEDSAVTDKVRSSFADLVSHPATTSENARLLAVVAGPLSVVDHFDLKAGSRQRLSLEDFASEIVHSDALVWWGEEKASYGFFVTSYRNTKTRLLFVPAAYYLEIIDRVLNDIPTKWYSTKDLKTGKISRHAE